MFKLYLHKQNKTIDWFLVIHFANYITHKTFQLAGLSIHSRENCAPFLTDGKLSCT